MKSFLKKIFIILAIVTALLIGFRAVSTKNNISVGAEEIPQETTIYNTFTTVKLPKMTGLYIFIGDYYNPGDSTTTANNIHPASANYLTYDWTAFDGQTITLSGITGNLSTNNACFWSYALLYRGDTDNLLSNNALYFGYGIYTTNSYVFDINFTETETTYNYELHLTTTNAYNSTSNRSPGLMNWITYDKFNATDSATNAAYNNAGDNLLKNGDFTLNRNGKLLYDTSGFTVDNWRILSNNVFDVDSKTLTSTSGSKAYILQDLGLETTGVLLGNTVTLSVFVNDELKSITKTIPAELPDNTVSFIVNGTGFCFYIDYSASIGVRVLIANLPNCTARIGYAKLEFGSSSTAPYKITNTSDTYNLGYDQGYTDGNSYGYWNGNATGRTEGYNTAIAEGLNETGVFSSAISFMTVFFELITAFLSTKIAGNISLGLIVIGLPATFMIINLVISLVKKLTGGGNG